MKKEKIFISKPDNTKHEIDWIELNQLKKDILWIYDENIGQVNAAFAPSYSFKLKYWEYLTIDGDKWFYKEDKDFYKTGVLVILLCLCVEYNDLASGEQHVFKRHELPIIIKYLKGFKTKGKYEKIIKEKILIGLNIAISLTEEQLVNSDFEHKDLPKFLENINAIGDYFIISYYKSKIKNEFR